MMKMMSHPSEVNQDEGKYMYRLLDSYECICISYLDYYYYIIIGACWTKAFNTQEKVICNYFFVEYTESS